MYFSNLGLYESDTDDAAERPEEREVVTQYNGVCKGFLIKGKYPHMVQFQNASNFTKSTLRKKVFM